MSQLADLATHEWRLWLDKNLRLIEQDIRSLASAPCYLLCDANPPELPGVYLFSSSGEIKYVGEAKSGGGLYDRIMRKHIAGSDKHPLQRAYLEQFPDRRERRAFLKQNIAVQWVIIEDTDRIPCVERLMIQMLKPPLNLA